MDEIQLKAMILAAGRGLRMKPLTDKMPKPLLKVDGVSLLERHIFRLKEAGFKDLIINVSYLADQIIDLVNNVSFGVNIRISFEDEPLETAGGVVKALPFLGDFPFLLINADIWTDFEFRKIFTIDLNEDTLAHLVLVKNPPEHSSGDFELDNFIVNKVQGGESLTYTGIGVYRPCLFSPYNQSVGPLRPILNSAIQGKQVTGQLFKGRWHDIGTPDRFYALNNALNSA